MSTFVNSAIILYGTWIYHFPLPGPKVSGFVPSKSIRVKFDERSNIGYANEVTETVKSR